MVGKEEKRVMDDFGNIIYVLAAIGWFFWNAYRKLQQGEKQKGRKSQEKTLKPQPFETERSDPFQSLEEMILAQINGQKEEPKPVHVETVPKHQNQDRFVNLDLEHSHLPHDYKMSVSESGSHRVKRQVERLKEREEIQEHGLLDGLFPQEGFDLRKAVVLNAILERPYR